MHSVAAVPSCGPQRLWVARESDLEEVQNPHVSNVLPVDRMKHFYCMYVPLSFSFSKGHALVKNALNVFLFF